ncbi:NAD(P)-dependent dehydrogenase, short-chain alcohol dehydrogenase family [Bacteroidales bacterium WCE2004]|nr:NAD(P)-dependent dehydrogenase, short-chain alcohol dehydrogenase family [Bacteroidales bacterium WCE2004]
MDIQEYKGALAGKVALITGAGGGIGLETARCFVTMGAKVIVLDNDREKGERAEAALRAIPGAVADYYYIDLADEGSFAAMKAFVLGKYGCPDIVFNNAAVLHLGAVGAICSQDWDHGYRVNFKAPVLLVNCFLEEMKRRDSGTFVFVSSSGAAAYMGAYEIFKTAQGELAGTLAQELEGTGIRSYTIGPGLVKTETARKSIAVVAAKMNLSEEAFYEMNKDHIISVEDAALGFALSVLHADEYNGQEIGSLQVLGGLAPKEGAAERVDAEVLGRVARTFSEQYQGWKERNVFERQWVLRDFRKCVGRPADEVQARMQELAQSGGLLAADDRPLLEALVRYWQRQDQLLQSFEKDPQKRQEHSRTIHGWIADLQSLLG